MAPKDEPRPDSAGEGGDDGGIDLGALVARLEQVERRQKRLIQLHRRLGAHAAGEFAHLLDD